MAVDQSTGQAYVDLYSTRDDATRRTAKFYARAVVPGAGSTRVSYGPLTPVSDDATDYSDQDCCGFGNDYGDYTGLDAAGGNMYAVWTHRLLGERRRRLRQRAAAVPCGLSDGGARRTTPMAEPSRRRRRRRPPHHVHADDADHADDGHHADDPTVDRTPPRLKVTFATRADRKGRYTVKLAARARPRPAPQRCGWPPAPKRKLASGAARDEWQPSR